MRTDATAFGYSILITATFGVLALEARPVTVLRILLFVWGATSAFTIWEVIVTRGFEVRVREERSEVLLVGTALAPIAVSIGLGGAVMAARWSSGAWSWAAAPLTATAAYVLATGLQLALARRWDERHPPDDEE